MNATRSVDEPLMIASHRDHLIWPKPVIAGPRYRYARRRWQLLARVIDAVGEPISRLARAIGLFDSCRRRAAWPPRSILIVQLDHVGDAVLTTTLVRALARRFPDAAIDVLASAGNREVFETNPHVRRVQVSPRNWHGRSTRDRAWLGELLRLGRAMRPNAYDLGIDPRGDIFVAGLLALAGIPRRLGWSCGGGGFLFTDRADWDARRHEIDSRFALFAAIDPRGGPCDDTRPEVHPSWSDRYRVREWLAALPGPSNPLTVLHASAGTAAKRWPLERMQSLVARLRRELGGTIILIGDSRDCVRSRQLARSEAGVVDWTGRLRLLELAALLEEADLFIGADSGPAHIAAATDTPSVVLFSGTNRAECWSPRGAAVRVLSHPVPCSPCHQRDCPLVGHPCMAGITVDDVVRAAFELRSPRGAIRSQPASHAARTPTKHREAC